MSPIRRSLRGGGSGSASESGQIILEFLILFIILLTVIFTFIEICLLAIEKFEFDRVARYAARVWLVKVNPEPEEGGWDAETAFRESAKIREDDATMGTSPGYFYKLQSQIGSGRETTRNGRKGVELRSFLPLLMPFTDLYFGHRLKPADAELLDPAHINPTASAGDLDVMRNMGIRRVICARAFIPMDRDLYYEDPTRFDNDYDDNFEPAY